VSYAIKILIVASLLLSLTVITAAQVKPLAFEVASIKPTPPDWGRGRFATMQGAHQFVARISNSRVGNMHREAKGQRRQSLAELHFDPGLGA
jgi:hypothetical protein